MNSIDNIPVLMKIPPEVPWTNGTLSMEKSKFSSNKIDSNVVTDSGSNPGSISYYTDNNCVRKYSKSKSLYYKPNRIDLIETNQLPARKELNCSLSIKTKENYEKVIAFLKNNNVLKSNICSSSSSGGKKKRMTKKIMRTTKRKFKMKRKQRRKSLRGGKAKTSGYNSNNTRRHRLTKIKRKKTRNVTYKKKKGKFGYTKKKYSL